MSPCRAKLQYPKKVASGYFSDRRQLNDTDLECRVNDMYDDADEVTFGIH